MVGKQGHKVNLILQLICKGAETPLYLATGSEIEGVTNRYYDSKQEKDCNYRETVASIVAKAY